MGLTIKQRFRAWFAFSTPIQFIGVAFWFAAAISLFIGSHFWVNFSGATEIDLLGAFINHVWIPISLFAKRLTATNAKQSMAMNPGIPYLLYLRSFTADETKWGRPSDEHILGKALKGLGPQIAFGDPGRRLPHLGPARLQMEYRDDWIEVVEQWTAGARLIVLKVGDTPGVIDEARMILTKVDISKVLFCFSVYLSEKKLRNLYENFNKAVKHDLPKQLPVAENLKNHRCIRFDSEGSPELLANIEVGFTVRLLRWAGWVTRPIIAGYLGSVMKCALRPINGAGFLCTVTRFTCALLLAVMGGVLVFLIIGIIIGSLGYLLGI